MVSQIDPTKPLDDVPAVKADLRANLAAAKSEIEALQDTKADVTHVHALTDSLIGASRDLTLADGANTLLRVDSPDAVTLTVPAASSVSFPSGTTINLVRWGAGALTIAAATGVVLHMPSDRAPSARTRYSVLGLWQQAEDVWLLYGDLA